MDQQTLTLIDGFTLPQLCDLVLMLTWDQRTANAGGGSGTRPDSLQTRVSGDGRACAF